MVAYFNRRIQHTEIGDYLVKSLLHKDEWLLYYKDPLYRDWWLLGQMTPLYRVWGFSWLEETTTQRWVIIWSEESTRQMGDYLAKKVHNTQGVGITWSKRDQYTKMGD